MERGDLRYVILDLLKDRPSYGYEIIQALEDRFHGFYSPSAGTVYPTLQWLQDLGYVSVAEADGRKMYTITDAGRAFLAERKEKVDEVWERMAAFWGGPQMRDEWRQFGHEMRDLGRDMRDLFKDLRYEAGRMSPEKLGRVRQVVAQATRDIEKILREQEAPSAPPPPAGQPEPPAPPPTEPEPPAPPAGDDRPRYV
jgi:DNA-binding PadR family transcriptional regulator